jgi:hypothetical protein
MKAGKTGAIFLAFVMALGGAGAGYALWSETLYIEGTVYTGEVNVTIAAGDSWDTEPPEKDVSNISCYTIDDTLFVLVQNAYPCIDYYQNFTINNTGTIPVKLGPLNITYNELPSGHILEITPDSNDTQLEPDEEFLGAIHIHLDNNATENTTYLFEADVTAYQWNEFPWP